MSSTNVFVSNLSKTIDEATLKSFFDIFGNVLSVRILRDQMTQLSRGIGFVQFDSPAASMMAVLKMNGCMLEGTAITVKLADRDAGAKTGPSAQMMGFAGAAAFGGRSFGLPGAVPATPRVHGNVPSDNVFVNGIPLNWTQVELASFFSAYGTIVSCVTLKEKATGNPRGAGLMRFTDIQSAATAIQSVNGYALDANSKPLEVRFADAKPSQQSPAAGGRFQPYPQPFGGRGGLRPTPMGSFGQSTNPALPSAPFSAEEGTNLHVTGLDSSIQDVHLFQTFAPYGAIVSVKAITDPTTGQCKGYGFVQFMRQSEAHAAIEGLNQSVVSGRTWTVSMHKKKAPVM